METTKSLRISSLVNDVVCCQMVAVPPVSVGGDAREVIGGSAIGSGKGVASRVEGELERDDDVKEGKE
jgi:hypothetical protein